jgi:hypothetical protein
MTGNEKSLESEVAAEELRLLVASLQARIEELEQRIDAVPAGAHDDRGERAAELPAPPDRRRLLLGLGMGAVAAGAAVVGTAVPAAAAAGSFDGSPGVTGEANPSNGIGVLGFSATGIGVRGSAQGTAGKGVHGTATGDQTIGVHGYSGGTDGIGVKGHGGGQRGIGLEGLGQTGLRAAGYFGAILESSGTHLRLDRGVGPIAPPPQTSAARSVGEIVFDDEENLWLCVTSGAPGVWRRVSGTSTVGSLTVLPSAVRAYDSRAGQAPTNVTKGPLLAAQERVVDLKIGGGVPAGAQAALLNVTVTNTSAAGFLKLFKPGAAVPTASAINWFSQGSNIANNATVAVSPTATVSVRCGGTAASTDVIVDVVGYYR